MKKWNRKKISKGLLITVAVILGAWIVLTWWAESREPSRQWIIGNDNAVRKALLIYDPDPFYNLDEKVCRSMGQALAENDFQCTVATVATAEKGPNATYDLYVFCANTYNWRPDRAVTSFINDCDIKNRPVVAMTLGSGSTTASKKALEQCLLRKGARLLSSKTFWLLRPNDESRMKESNVKVAEELAYDWAQKIARDNFSPTAAQVK